MNIMKTRTRLLSVLLMLSLTLPASSQERRPIDARHPMWLVHVDVWNKADPQKIINLIPEDIRPYVCLNLSLSCQYDTERNVYKMPQNAVKTYKSWGTVCQANGMWFTCQPASGGHTHIQDNDLETFEYFFKRFPNFLGWNYAEQFWGFDEAGDKSSSSQASRIALFANLVEMSHKYGGFLTVSFCGNIWSHLLNPLGMMKRNTNLYNACKKYPEAILWLYKYTTSSCFYNNESVTFGPFVSGLAKNYGVRYDNCGWNGALSSLMGEGHGKKYPIAAGIGTVMEQTCVNGGAVWDGPELIWTEDFQNLNNSTVDGYTRRNWGTFPGFRNAWIDMFRKIIDGTLYIPTRDEVVDNTKIAVINDVSSGNDEQKYAAWGDLYDGLYKQTDPMNSGNGQWMNNYCYFKKTGRYHTIPVTIGLYDQKAKTIPVQVKKSAYSSRWTSQTVKVNEFNRRYPEVSTGDLYVSRHGNQLITYTPYSYFNKKREATGHIPLQYNTCDSLILTLGMLGSGAVREYADHIDFYLNNYRTDTTNLVTESIVLKGVAAEPTVSFKRRVDATGSITRQWNEADSIFTIMVRHMGPVDLSVQCEGKATERSTTYLNSETLSTDPPRQPHEYYGPITIEAEDMDYKNVKSCVTDPYNWYPNVYGHAGNGFMDMGTNTAGSLRHTIQIAHPGDYNIYIRYMSTAKAGNIVAVVNTTRQVVKCEKTGQNEWKRVAVAAKLNKGQNTFTINNTTGLNMYIDNITYSPSDVPEEQYAITLKQAAGGTVQAPDSAVEGERVVLNVVPDEGYKLSGWTVTHGAITISDDSIFYMPDDNVTLTPIFSDLTEVYRLDFANVVTGTMPPGWMAVQENNETHQYPNNYSAGARTFVGFVGHQGKALYWRDGKCEYGRQAAYPLQLEAGWYKLSFATAAWKARPKYVARILSATDDDVVAESNQYYALPNANGSTGATITSARTYELTFNITQPGRYVISFVNLDVVDGFDEFLLAECWLNTTEDPTAIEHIMADRQPHGTNDNNGNAFSNHTMPDIYDMQGRQLAAPRKGINIVGGRKVLIK